MRAVVWISESTWESCVDQAVRLVPPQAQVTLLHVAPSDAIDIAGAGREGLLGRRRPRPGPALEAIADEEALALLAAAQARLGRPSDALARRGRIEREVVAACADADLLVLARDGEPRLGPRSLGPHTRFVVDHAPCATVLVWAERPPGIETVPPRAAAAVTSHG